MTIEELRDIFKPQLDAGYPHLFYMIARPNSEPRLKVYKCSELDLESLLSSLSKLSYTGIFSGMPRFYSVELSNGPR